MPASNVAEILKDRKDAEAEERAQPYYPPKPPRKWGRRRRALWREQHVSQYDPVGAVWHFSTAAAKIKFDKAIAVLKEQNLPPEDFKLETESLIYRYGTAVPVHLGMNAKVRHDFRSRLMKEQRRESELGSQEDELSSENDSPSDNT